jgi:AcrR family transcriptional regulator
MPIEQPAAAAGTRDRIVEAARQVMHDIGLSRATTKEIARAAGCSEATLYKYFASKEELFIAVVRSELPTFGALLGRLLTDPGRRTTEQALTDLAREATLFYEAAMPLGAALFAEPGLLQRQRDLLRQLGVGPHLPLLAVARFLAAEIERGRLPADADPEAGAALLLGACFQRAFLRRVMGDGDPLPSIALATTTDEFAAAVARGVLRGLS